MQWPQSSFPSTTASWYPAASPCPPDLHGVYQPRDRSILSSRSPQSLEPYAQTLDRPLPFNPGPQPVTRLGRNPLRRLDHRMVTRPFGRINPLAVLPAFALGCLSGTRHPVHRHNPARIVLTRSAPVTIRLEDRSWLQTSNSSPAIAHTTYRISAC